MSGRALNLHASCVVLGEAGLLLRGASGTGKSTLARRLIAARLSAGGFAAWVADDRVIVEERHGRLIARPHPAIAGIAEHRGIGLVAVPCEPAAVLRLVVDLTDGPAPRLPSEVERETCILGVTLPRIAGMLAEADALVEAAMPWQR